VGVYFAGHDHCEEHLTEGKFTNYHVVGAANQNQGSAPNKAKVPAGSLKFLDIGTGIIKHEFEGGFASVVIDGSGLVVKHFRTDADGYTLKYAAPAVPKRTKKNAKDAKRAKKAKKAKAAAVNELSS
jgi:hypothetical protein